jgi:hypothetical protein
MITTIRRMDRGLKVDCSAESQNLERVGSAFSVCGYSCQWYDLCRQGSYRVTSTGHNYRKTLRLHGDYSNVAIDRAPDLVRELRSYEPLIVRAVWGSTNEERMRAQTVLVMLLVLSRWRKGKK